MDQGLCPWEGVDPEKRPLAAYPMAGNIGRWMQTFRKRVRGEFDGSGLIRRLKGCMLRGRKKRMIPAYPP